jgi:nicotinamidase-related amidase
MSIARCGFAQDALLQNAALESEASVMATVREGNKAALIVVDVQVGVVSGAWDVERIVGNISRTVERARHQGVPIIWVQHSDSDMAQGSTEWQWVPDLVPRAGEPLIHKQFNSSFEQTALEEELATLGAAHLVLAGALTNWCIRATAYAALERGYDLTLVSDAHTTSTMELEGGAKIEAASVIADLNVAMTWLSYPGRRNGTAKAEALDFAALAGLEPNA